MKQKTGRMLPGVLLALAMVVGLLQGLALTAQATTAYGAYLVASDDTSETLPDKVVHFNRLDWYILADNSMAVNEGTVTLFSKDAIGDKTAFNEKLSDGNDYNGSKIKGAIDALTAEGGSFADVANAIKSVDLEDVNVTGAKLYLLSTEEAANLPLALIKFHDYWWLRSKGTNGDEYAACVNGEKCTVRGQGSSVDYIDSVRPALKLDLSRVTFDSATKTFIAPHTPAIGEENITFADLDPKAWYHDGVHWALENGVMNGVGGGKFDPDGATSRGMIVTILYRLEGAPMIRSGMPFSDVTESDWYGMAVSWAESKGIVNGYEDGTFRPNEPITREQLAAILYRYAQTKGEGFTGLWSFQLDFPDAGEVSDWANEAVSWMVMNGIVGGKDGKLVPGGNASRAEAATMLQRFCEALAK